MNKQEIKNMLFNVETMVENLKVKSTEYWQQAIIQYLYNIKDAIELIDNSENYELQKENLLLISENIQLKKKLELWIDMLKLAKAVI